MHVSAALASIIACNPRSEVRRQSHVPVLHMLDSCGILFLAVLRAHLKGRLLLRVDNIKCPRLVQLSKDQLTCLANPSVSAKYEHHLVPSCWATSSLV